MSTDSANPTVMQYDGVYTISAYGEANYLSVYLNASLIATGMTGNNNTGASTSVYIPFKKGDTLYRTSSPSIIGVEKVAYFQYREI